MNGVIYRATNTKNGLMYIGASTKPLKQRKIDHLQKANNDIGYKFHEAIKEFGSDTFIWEEIDTANSMNDLATKEKYWISYYNSKENGYNSDSGGGFKKKVYQYDSQGNFLAEYDCLQSAGNSVNAEAKSISSACLGYNVSCKGYFWSYNHTETYLLKDTRKKEVVQYDLDGNFIKKFNSVADASKETGISKTCISRCCRNERPSTGGYTWNYL